VALLQNLKNKQQFPPQFNFHHREHREKSEGVFSLLCGENIQWELLTLERFLCVFEPLCLFFWSQTPLNPNSGKKDLWLKKK
jgi:hypothetical protein